MMTTKEEKRELLHRKWEEQIAECESSNMPVKEWCAENGVNLNTFYARISALKKDKLKQSVQQTQEIVPLSVIQESGTTNSETVVPKVRPQENIVIRKNGIEIILPPDVSENMIYSLLRGLKQC
ncbi:MAG: IS66 family insertion sequence element accessory protein TnpB [Ruminococcus sp.]|nr:IS66 family insertion sequence element accessory protein TnpB [Ruminococcus sp.]